MVSHVIVVMLSIAKRLWALPWTLCGLLIGVVGLTTGGHARRYRGTIGFDGAAVAAFLRHCPIIRGASAMALGHVVLAQTSDDLESAYEHELVHVRQYERWGPLFVPAYVAASAWQKLRGRHPYWDNPFEREAYDATT
jgi:hypothetical protein